MAACDPRPNVGTRFSLRRDANWFTAAGFALRARRPSARRAARARLRCATSAPRCSQGEVWRLVSAHLVHADVAHLAWNLAGAALVWWLFAGEFTRRGWCLVMLASTAAIDLGFILFEPQIEWYVGFSGVLHGCMAAGLVAWLRKARDPLTIERDGGVRGQARLGAFRRAAAVHERDALAAGRGRGAQLRRDRRRGRRAVAAAGDGTAPATPL